MVGLSGLLPEKGSYATVDVGGRSVILTRDEQGQAAAMLNVCRHRGAEITNGCGKASVLQCPYHGWTYRLDGTGAARRRADHFDGVELADLVALPVKEQDGLIWVSADPAGTIEEQPLHGAEVAIQPLDLEHHDLFAQTSFSRRINWKLAIDTFLRVVPRPGVASRHHRSDDPW